MTRVEKAVKDWQYAERMRVLADRTAKLFRESYLTLGWRCDELRARERLRHAVIMAEAGGSDEL